MRMPAHNPNDLARCMRRDVVQPRVAPSSLLAIASTRLFLSFWKAGSARNGSQIGSSLKSAGVTGVK